LGNARTVTVVVTLTLLSVVKIIVYVPAATPAPITKVPGTVIDPPAIVHGVGEVTSPAVVEVMVHVVEAASNPDPLTLIVVPGGPSSGEAVIDGTENGAVATSPARPLATLTTYEPGVAPEATTKEADTIFPNPSNVQVDELIRFEGPVDEIVHVVPPEANGLVVAT